jgi:hypothetical protein
VQHSRLFFFRIYDTIDTESEVSAMTKTNAMITYVAQKFGADSGEAIRMRFMVRAYLLRKGVTYEECLTLYKALMKKKAE